MSDTIQAVVSLSGMAKTGRPQPPRFHQLMRQGVFPPPVYDVRTRRPHYTEEMQKVCMAVREKNVGVNGQVVLFYARRPGQFKKTQDRGPLHPRSPNSIRG